MGLDKTFTHELSVIKNKNNEVFGLYSDGNCWVPCWVDPLSSEMISSPDKYSSIDNMADSMPHVRRHIDFIISNGGELARILVETRVKELK